MKLLLVTIVCLLLTQIFCKNADTIEYYKKLIANANKTFYTYKLPHDASEYAPADDQTPKDFGSFDFIIIGSGAAGSVIANRLSEIEDWSILLLEAGGYGNNVTDMVAMSSYLTFSKYNWGYTTVPQNTSCLGCMGRICTYPAGKGIGGSTLINDVVYSRGNAADYDTWADLADDDDWSYEEVLPLFKNLERLNLKDNEDARIDKYYHGMNGDLSVEIASHTASYTKAFFEASESLGYEYVDYNGEEEIGASPFQLNTINGRRDDNGKAFVKPVRRRKNLKIQTHSYVTKIIISIQSKKATGVDFSYKKRAYRAQVNNEIILSGGTVGSPHILMLSGIGPRRHLAKVGIKTIKDLQVGSQLHDHIVLVGLAFSTNVSKENLNLEDSIKEYIKGRGPLTSVVGGVGFYQTNVEKTPDYPDFEILPVTFGGRERQLMYNLTDELYNILWKPLVDLPTSGFFTYMFLLHPKSTGLIRLKSSNPYDYPSIDTKFLSDPNDHDIETLYQGIQFVLKLIETGAFKKIDTKLSIGKLTACSDNEFLSKAFWYCHIRHTTTTGFHPTGTCTMGPDPKTGAVVDSELRVHGIENLRVADASIIPLPLSGHTSAACSMIGERLSNLLKEQYL